VLTLPLEDDAFINPHHVNAHSWVAVISGPNAARVERVFLNRGGDGFSTVDATLLREGDALEFCADRGRDFDRRFYVVARKTEAEMALRPFPTMSQALRANREWCLC
jgi:hypothetical protein